MTFRCLFAVSALALLAGAPALATPYTPVDDGVVLERLPEKIDPSLRDVKRLRAALDRNPRDLGLAARLARRAIEAARETGDPRFLGQARAALAPWWNESDPPPSAMLLRATLKQSTHDFPGALADLDRLIAARPTDIQALLTRSTISSVQGRYAQARADCTRIAGAVPLLVAAACDAAPASLSGEAGPAYQRLVAAIEPLGAAPANAGLVEWGRTLAGEIAQRRGDVESAETNFRAALAIDARDPYLLAAYSDLLLERNRPTEVVALLKEYTRNDNLLLRLALAEARLPELGDSFGTHRAELEDRFAAARRRGDSLHQREEARFALEIAGDGPRAIALARANWKIQRESADLRVLVAAARAASDEPAMLEARNWVREQRLEDVSLAALLEAR
jgi:predicted Zn-dependent protease